MHYSKDVYDPFSWIYDLWAAAQRENDTLHWEHTMDALTAFKRGLMSYNGSNELPDIQVMVNDAHTLYTVALQYSMSSTK